VNASIKEEDSIKMQWTGSCRSTFEILKMLFIFKERTSQIKETSKNMWQADNY